MNEQHMNEVQLLFSCVLKTSYQKFDNRSFPLYFWYDFIRVTLQVVGTMKIPAQPRTAFFAKRSR